MLTKGPDWAYQVRRKYQILVSQSTRWIGSYSSYVKGMAAWPPYPI